MTRLCLLPRGHRLLLRVVRSGTTYPPPPPPPPPPRIPRSGLLPHHTISTRPPSPPPLTARTPRSFLPSTAASSSSRFSGSYRVPVAAASAGAKSEAVVASPMPSPSASGWRLLSFAVVAALGGCIGGGIVVTAGGLGSETDRAYEYQDVCYVLAKGGMRGIPADTFGFEDGLRGIPADEFEESNKLAVNLAKRANLPVADNMGHLAILQLKGTPGNPALLETMSCQFPNPVSLFKEIRKLKVKENLGKFSELLLNKVLLGLKIFGKWVLEAIKEELVGRAKKIVITWIIAMASYLLGQEMTGTNEQLEDLRRDVVEDLKRDLVNVLLED